MSATAKVAGAAIAGTLAAWLIEGEFTWRSLARLVGNVALSAAMAVIAMYFVLSFAHAPEVVQWALSGTIGALTMHVTRRLKGADVSIKIGTVASLTSEGIPEHDA